MRLLLALLFTVNAFAGFTTFPPNPVAPDTLVTKGGLLTSTGSAQVEATACADDEIIVYDSAEVNGFKCEAKPVASAGGTNFISNGDFETDLTGWSIYHDTPSPAPVDCTGSAGSGISMVRDTGAPLVGIASLAVESEFFTNSQGEGVSTDFSIDTGYLGQELEMTLLTNTTYSANYSTGHMQVYIFDVTNNAFIGSGQDIIAGRNTQSFKFTASSTSTSYRACVHIASTNSTSLFGATIDAVKIAPASAVDTNAGGTNPTKVITGGGAVFLQNSIAPYLVPSTTFNNLETGKVYRYCYKIVLSTGTTSQPRGHVTVTLNGSTVKSSSGWSLYNTSDFNSASECSIIIGASTGDSIQVYTSVVHSNAYVLATTAGHFRASLEELNNYEATTKWD